MAKWRKDAAKRHSASSMGWLGGRRRGFPRPCVDFTNTRARNAGPCCPRPERHRREPSRILSCPDSCRLTLACDEIIGSNAAVITDNDTDRTCVLLRSRCCCTKRVSNKQQHQQQERQQKRTSIICRRSIYSHMIGLAIPMLTLCETRLRVMTE